MITLNPICYENQLTPTVKLTATPSVPSQPSCPMAYFLEEQSKQYQSHLKKLRTTLNFQHNIRNYKTIPKQYSPSSFLEIPADNQSTLTANFQQEYNKLFFKYLNQVLTYNTISLELEESRLKNFVSHVKESLTRSSLSPTETNLLFENFLADNNIANYQTSPTLQTPDASSTPSPPAANPTPPPPPPPSVTPPVCKPMKRKRCLKRKK